MNSRTILSMNRDSWTTRIASLIAVSSLAVALLSHIDESLPEIEVTSNGV